MGYPVFISHSSKDIELVNYLSSRLRHHEITPIIAQKERPKEYPQHIVDKIKNLIQKSDCVVVLLTKDGIKSNWVHQEIGYTLGKKPLIPLVESDIASSELGFLEGTEYIQIHRENFNLSLRKLLSWTAQLKIDKEKREFLEFLIALFIAGLALWWLSKKNIE